MPTTISIVVVQFSGDATKSSNDFPITDPILGLGSARAVPLGVATIMSPLPTGPSTFVGTRPCSATSTVNLDFN